jgi:light-regulated signal transduction histidine kinase (bacteriophytochrome)
MKKLNLITNKLLARQVKRVFDPNAELSDDLIKLLQMINQSYEHYERDRQLIERAMDISSEELRSSYKNLADQNEELELFVSKVSHDLKAPIRTINSFAQLINRELRKSDHDNDAKIVDYLSFITNGAQNMHLLIENLLFHARLGLKLELQDRIDLNELIQTVQNNLGGLIQENKATIMIETLPVVYGRSHEVLQLFQNLMGNAIKFKRKGVDPLVKISCNERESEYIISVEDNGIGIQSKDKASIFGAFHRLNGASDYEGTGLGLSICKKIVDNFGGRIWVESELGQGTIFIFSLPKGSKTESNIKNSNVNVNNQITSQSNILS